jgi:hypothetical protein
MQLRLRYQLKQIKSGEWVVIDHMQAIAATERRIERVIYQSRDKTRAKKVYAYCKEGLL